MKVNDKSCMCSFGWHYVFLCCGFLSFFTIFSGCQSTGTGSKYNLSLTGPEVKFSSQEQKQNQENILVTIRIPKFPCGLESSTNFNFKDESPHSFIDDFQKTWSCYNEAVCKTTMAAMEVYDALSSVLPPNSVVIQAAEERDAFFIDEMNDEWSYKVYAPISGSGYFPSPLVVDLLLCKFCAKDPTEKVPMTFADLVCPVISIETSLQAAPTTLGAIACSDPYFFDKYRFDESRGAYGGLELSYPEYSIRSTSSNKNGDGVKKHKVGDNLNNTKEMNFDIKETLPVLTGRQPRQINKLLVFPVKNLSQNTALIREMTLGKQSAYIDATKAHIHAILDALNKLDIYFATRNNTRDYIAYFDEDLAIRYPNSELSETDKFKLSLIGKYKQKEREFLSKLTKQLFEKMYSGDSGAAMRELRVSELNYLEKLRQNIKAKNSATVGSIFGGIAMGLSSYSASAYGNTGANTPNTQNLTLAMETLSAEAERSAAETEILTKSFQENFSNILTDLSDEINIMLEETIGYKAKNSMDLRDKFRGHFKEKVTEYENKMPKSSYTETYPDCSQGWVWDAITYRLSHGTENKSGNSVNPLNITVKWTGACQNKLAYGYGVLSFYKNGKYAGEYEGEMKNGQFNGLGFLILPYGEEGLFYSIEGEFSDGYPNGIALVNMPGKEPSYEIYSTNQINDKTIKEGKSFINYIGHTASKKELGETLDSFNKNLERLRDMRSKFNL